MLFLGNKVDHFVRDAQVFDRVAADVARRDLPETIAVSARADHFLQVHVHERVDADEVAVVGLTVLQLHENWMSNSSL